MPVSARTRDAQSNHPNAPLFPLMRRLEAEYQRLLTKSKACAPPFGTIPVGGGDWMDYHFKSEAVFGLLAALRFGKPLEAAIQDGIEDCKYAIALWNGRREYQVRRWEQMGDGYLRALVFSLKGG